MKTFKIKITGEGTFSQIQSALLDIARIVSFEDEPDDDFKCEDPTLMTEITEEYRTNPADVDAYSVAYAAHANASAVVNKFHTDGDGGEFDDFGVLIKLK